MFRKNRYFILILLLIQYGSSAQEITWQKSYGGTGWDELRSVVKTPDNGYLVAGFSSSGLTGDKTEGCQGNLDFWVLKLDSSGTIEWQNTIGGSDEDRAFATCVAPDGGYVITGSSRSGISGDKSDTCRGDFDYWIVRLDLSGNIVWQKTFGGSNEDVPFAIVATHDHGYAIAGTSLSPLSGDKTEDTLGYDDYWLIRIDSVGNLLWQNTIGGAGYDKHKVLLETQDHGWLIGGWSRSGISGDKTEARMGKSDVWVLKLDSIGQILWQQSIGGSEEDQLFDLIEKSNGKIVGVASSDSPANFDKSSPSRGGTDYWIFELSATGVLQWERVIGGNEEDIPSAVLELDNSELMVAGYSASGITGEKSEDGFGDVDYWIVHTDSAGMLLSQRTFGGHERDYLYALVRSEPHRFVAGGFSRSMISGSKTEGSPSDDYWIISFTDNINTISGNVWLDADKDTLIAPAERHLGNYLVRTTGCDRVGFTNTDGEFQIPVLDTGNVNMELPPLPYYYRSPLTSQANFNGYPQEDTAHDIAVADTGTYEDLRVRINRVSACENGSPVIYAIGVENNGADTLQAQVVLYPDARLLYQNAVPAPVSWNNDSIIWQTVSLLPLEYTSLYVSFTPDPLLVDGDQLSSRVVITGQGPDFTPSDNADTLVMTFGDTLHSSGMVVNIDTIPTAMISNPPDLEYTVYFTNTDTQTVHRVVTLHTIPQKLFYCAFELMSASDSINISFENQSRMLKFDFNGVNLPPASVNPLDALGYARFRIRTKPNLTLYRPIVAQSLFYFDGSEPLVSNEATTMIGNFTSLEENNHWWWLQLQPNPAGKETEIVLPDLKAAPAELKVTSLSGQVISTDRIVAPAMSFRLNVEQLQPGIYFIQLTTASGRYLSKLIVY